MKVALGSVLSTAFKSTLGLVVVGGLLTGCGEEATNPEAVDLTELKYPLGLSIQDQGGGTVRLSWSGMNNEEDFSGYNIYGVKDNATITALNGSSVQLLTEEGEQDADGKTTLSMMSYNGSDWETKGEEDPDLDAEFQFTPFYANTDADGNAFLPSCRPSAGGQACDALTETTQETPGDYAFNGTTYMDMTGLKMGKSYCFTVASTLDSGKKISSTTSNVSCVVPRASVSVDLTAESSGKILDFTALRKSCDDAGTCDKAKLDGATVWDGASAFASDDVGIETLAACTAATPYTACLENFTSKPYLTAGAGGAIQDLGYYPGGFADSTFVPASELTWDSKGVIHAGGYSLEGQSYPIDNNHIYVVAESKDSESKTFFYHYVYVSGLGDDGSAIAMNMSIRVAQTEGDR